MSNHPKIAGTKYKSGQRWEVEPVLLGNGMSFPERDHQYQFRVMDKATGQTVAAFHRDEILTGHGIAYTGVKSVEISDDDSAVVTIFEDGRKESHPLPV